MMMKQIVEVVKLDNDNAQRGIKLDSQNINKKKKGGCCGAKDK